MNLIISARNALRSFRGREIGRVSKRYSNLGRIVIFTDAILPRRDMGSLFHFSIILQSSAYNRGKFDP